MPTLDLTRFPRLPLLTLPTLIEPLDGLTRHLGGALNGVRIFVKRDDVAGTWLESHFRWQIRTFWFGLLWSVLGVLSLVVVVGFAVLFANLVWFIYRIVKGWIRLNEGRPMYEGVA